MNLREKFEENEVQKIECCCPECVKQEILDEYLEVILDARNVEEVRELLEELFDEAQELLEDEIEDFAVLDEIEDEFIELDDCVSGGITINGDVFVSVYMKPLEEV